MVSTKGEEVVSNKQLSHENISPCKQEEADTRIFIHVKDIQEDQSCHCGLGRDSYPSCGVFTLKREKQLQELWIEFGVGKDKKWIPIHRYAEVLGQNVCMALPFFHAFTGSDTTSPSAGRVKKQRGKHGKHFQILLKLSYDCLL